MLAAATMAMTLGASALMAAAAHAQVTCGGVDDTATVQAAAISGTPLPAGVCRIKAPITALAGANGAQSGTIGPSYFPGIRLVGAGMLRTTILADYNGDVARGAIVLFDTTAPLKFTAGSEIRDLTITQVPGRTGLNGVMLTAAWYVKIERVAIDALSGNGLIASWRSDLHPTISDGYQAFSVEVEQSHITRCTGWGVKFDAGQSPGLWSIRRSVVGNNPGGGILSTTGQFELVGNLIVGNGTYGGQGGLRLDTREGPSMVADIRQNEFDTNFNWHVSIMRSRSARFTQNRFLSWTFASNTSYVPESGSQFMRPWVHVSLGGGPTNEVWDILFEQNFHRTVMGPAQTTATVIAYTASTGSVVGARFIHNSLGYRDGINQNSTGLRAYVNMPPDTIIEESVYPR